MPLLRFQDRDFPPFPASAARLLADPSDMPDEACQLASHGDDRFLPRLPLANELSEFAAQAFLRPARCSNGLVRPAFATFRQRSTGSILLGVCPSRFYQYAPKVRVANLRDAVAPHALTRAVLSAHQVGIAHELDRVWESPEITGLDRHRERA